MATDPNDGVSSHISCSHNTTHSPLFLKEYQSHQIWVEKSTLQKLEKISKKTLSYKQIPSYPPSNSPILIEIQASHYIGLINIDSHFSIVITPKIESANFIAMLHYVYPDRIHAWESLFSGIKQEQNFISAFLKVFFNQILTLLRENYRKGYSFHQDKHTIPQGRINIRQTLNQRSTFPPQIVCEQFRFDLDIPHNQIIKYTLGFIQPLVPSSLIRIYQELMKKLHIVSSRPWTAHEILNLSYSRLNHQYLPLHRMCILLLEDFSLLFQAGQGNFFSFVINSWNIFERFLFRIFEIYQDIYDVSSYSLDIPDDKISNRKQSVKFLPDIVLSKNHQHQIIIDAKYKISKSKIHDIDQMNRYTGAANQCIGFLIYPSKKPLDGLSSVFKTQEITLTQHGVQKSIYQVFLDLSIAHNSQKLQFFVDSIIKLYNASNKIQ